MQLKPPTRVLVKQFILGIIPIELITVFCCDPRSSPRRFQGLRWDNCSRLRSSLSNGQRRASATCPVSSCFCGSLNQNRSCAIAWKGGGAGEHVWSPLFWSVSCRFLQVWSCCYGKTLVADHVNFKPHTRIEPICNQMSWKWRGSRMEQIARKGAIQTWFRNANVLWENHQ